MHPRTVATLERLREKDWFRNAGVQNTKAADVLTSWEEAIDSCSSPEWIGLCQDAVNEYCTRIRERSPLDYEKWNDTILSVRPSALALVREKTMTVVQENDLPKIFLNTVGWDILHVCMESEFADIFPPGFFASQAYWYTTGHFPCGWRGPFPKGGKLVVY